MRPILAVGGLACSSSFDAYITETHPIAATAKVLLLLLTGYRQRSTIQRPQHLLLYLPTYPPPGLGDSDRQNELLGKYCSLPVLSLLSLRTAKMAAQLTQHTHLPIILPGTGLAARAPLGFGPLSTTSHRPCRCERCCCTIRCSAAASLAVFTSSRHECVGSQPGSQSKRFKATSSPVVEWESRRACRWKGEDGNV